MKNFARQRTFAMNIVHLSLTTNKHVHKLRISIESFHCICFALQKYEKKGWFFPFDVDAVPFQKLKTKRLVVLYCEYRAIQLATKKWMEKWNAFEYKVCTKGFTTRSVSLIPWQRWRTTLDQHNLTKIVAILWINFIFICLCLRLCVYIFIRFLFVRIQSLCTNSRKF